MKVKLMPEQRRQFLAKPHLWLIRLIGVIVPRRLQADWQQEWEAELHHREVLLAEWDRLNRRNKLDLMSLLFGLSPTDTVSLLSSVLLMLMVTLVAGYLPSRRATRVDPMVALRCE